MTSLELRDGSSLFTETSPYRLTGGVTRKYVMKRLPALLGTEDAQKAGYVQFEGHKYGEQSYLLTIPASEMTSGEYGIFYMSIITATAIPVGTFSIQ